MPAATPPAKPRGGEVAAPDLQQSANLLSRINVIWVVQSPHEKYFACAVGQITSTSFSHPVPQEGRWPSSRTLGRDAVDAIASCAPMAVAGRIPMDFRERSAGAQTNGAEADGKTVWSWHPLLMSSLRRRVGPTGLGRFLNPQMTVARRIRRRGERAISR